MRHELRKKICEKTSLNRYFVYGFYFGEIIILIFLIISLYFLDE